MAISLGYQFGRNWISSSSDLGKEGSGQACPLSDPRERVLDADDLSAAEQECVPRSGHSVDVWLLVPLRFALEGSSVYPRWEYTTDCPLAWEGEQSLDQGIW